MSNNENVNSLFIALRTTLARAVSHIVPPREVEDIVQETYVRVFQVGERDDIHHPRSFMLRTARNLALDHRKRSESRLADSMEDLQEDLQELATGAPGRERGHDIADAHLRLAQIHAGAGHLREKTGRDASGVAQLEREVVAAEFRLYATGCGYG